MRAKQEITKQKRVRKCPGRRYDTCKSTEAWQWVGVAGEWLVRGRMGKGTEK